MDGGAERGLHGVEHQCNGGKCGALLLQCLVRMSVALSPVLSCGVGSIHASCSVDGNGKSHCIRGRTRRFPNVPIGAAGGKHPVVRWRRGVRPRAGVIMCSSPPVLTFPGKSCWGGGGGDAPTCTSPGTASANPRLPKRGSTVVAAEGFAGELTDGRSPLPI